MHIFQEITPDRGPAKVCVASDNSAEYILTSAYAHDLYVDYVLRYARVPPAAWYRRHFCFEEKRKK